MRGLFPVVAMDRNRTVYEVWVTVSGSTSGADPTAWRASDIERYMRGIELRELQPASCALPQMSFHARDVRCGQFAVCEQQ